MKNVNKKLISASAAAAIVLSTVNLPISVAAAQQLEVTGAYADTFHFELKMEDAVGGAVSSANGISLKKTNGEIIP